MVPQVAVLPAFIHAKRNSELVAIVSDDRTKRREIAKKYRLDRAYSYREYERCLEEVDAVYIALPNSMHAEHTHEEVAHFTHCDRCSNIWGICLMSNSLEDAERRVREQAE